MGPELFESGSHQLTITMGATPRWLVVVELCWLQYRAEIKDLYQARTKPLIKLDENTTIDACNLTGHTTEDILRIHLTQKCCA